MRDKVKVFGNIGGATLDERARQAQALVEQGYTSLRTVPFFEGFEQRSPSQAVTDAIEIREEKLTTFPFKPYAIRGWFREDGSVAH